MLKLVFLCLIACFAFAQVVLPGGSPPVVPSPPPNSASAKKLTEALPETSGNALCVIELKTGQRIEGAIKQTTAAGAVIEVAGQSITIPLEKLKAIYFGAVISASPMGPSPARDALDALRGLRSVVESGLTYRDYATRVLDSKVKVDRYLSSSPNDLSELRVAIEIAMREYELAGKAWNLQGNGMAWMSMITPDLVERCPAVGRIIPKDEKGLKLLKALVDFESWDAARDQLKVDGQYAHHVLWKCAIAQSEKAEQIVR